MKIIVIGPDMPHTMGRLVTEELNNMGYNATLFSDRIDPRKFGVHIGKFLYLKDILYPCLSTNKQKQLYSLAVDFKPDLVLVISVGKIYPHIVEKLKQEFHCRVVAWYPDAFGNFYRKPLISADYDCIFTKCLDIKDRLLACGLTAYYLPEACAPKYDSRTKVNINYVCEITTAGTYYPYRLKLFEALKDRDLALYGILDDKFKNTYGLKKFIKGHDVYLEERSVAFSSAKLIVNTLHPSEANSVNVRLFEATCSGTLVLSEYRPVIESLYDIGSEIDVFRHRDELRKKAIYYLNNQELAIEMGKKASIRAKKEHTYRNRLSELLSVVWSS